MPDGLPSIGACATASWNVGSNGSPSGENDSTQPGSLEHVQQQIKGAPNLGRDDMISVDGLVEMISGIAGKRLCIRHDLSKPQGVRGRNSDNTLLRKVLGWEPSITLEQGLAITYRWIEGELTKAGRIPDTVAPVPFTESSIAVRSAASAD